MPGARRGVWHRRFEPLPRSPFIPCLSPPPRFRGSPFATFCWIEVGERRRNNVTMFKGGQAGFPSHALPQKERIAKMIVIMRGGMYSPTPSPTPTLWCHLARYATSKSGVSLRSRPDKDKTEHRRNKPRRKNGIRGRRGRLPLKV